MDEADGDPSRLLVWLVGLGVIGGLMFLAFVIGFSVGAATGIEIPFQLLP